MSKTKQITPEKPVSPPKVDNPSTRIFVSGLPPTFTKEQLAAHFGTRHVVTDAHVLPERRIGFVGFTDSENATKAVGHFNKSYIRMSKISVDLANPVEFTRTTSGNAVPQSKEKQTHKTEQSLEDTRKRKRANKDDGEELRSESKPSTRIEDNSEIQDDNKREESGTQDESKAQVGSEATDNDWLRGKTSRVLDLVDPDEDETPDPTSVADSQTHPNKVRMLDDDDDDDAERNKQADAEDANGVEESRVPVPNGRLFIRNLAFDISDEDLRQKFREFGKVQEAHVVMDAKSLSSKGTAFVQFNEPEDAESALKVLDGVAFHGRLIHILPAADKRDKGLTEYDISQMPLKKQKAVRRKLAASNATFSWNSLYMNPDAVLSSIADRLGVPKTDILDPTSADAAIKQAHAETQLIKETKEYLSSNGVNVEAFKSQTRDGKALLLKNFPYGTSEDELRQVLVPFGMISKFILPPSGTMAIVQYEQPYSATQALKSLAYKNIKGSVLYLEKAPLNIFSAIQPKPVNKDESTKEVTNDENATGPTVTVFVRNLNFSTSTARLKDLASSLPGFLTARVKTRVDDKKPGEVLSMGFGFMEFQNKAKAEAAVTALSGHNLDGHSLVVQLSNKSTDLAEEQRERDKANKRAANQTKIIIKNLPFQASKKDVRSLFSPYGQLKTVRVPRKFDNSTRGFAFAEFVTPKEAENAIEALSDTHLLGRRLVIQFAQGDDINPEEEIRAIEKKVEQQNNKVELNRLMSGSGRRKFNIDGARDDELV